MRLFDSYNKIQITIRFSVCTVSFSFFPVWSILSSCSSLR
uniref:Uncharacterized protein n=1 Tax=Rhizophora mucronata TaxID=61149 RepID=A0A2P2IR92_RHIMU